MYREYNVLNLYHIVCNCNIKPRSKYNAMTVRVRINYKLQFRCNILYIRKKVVLESVNKCNATQGRILCA